MQREERRDGSVSIQYPTDAVAVAVAVSLGPVRTSRRGSAGLRASVPMHRRDGFVDREDYHTLIQRCQREWGGGCSWMCLSDTSL